MRRGRGGGVSVEILLATSEENNSDVSMNVEATPTRLRISGQPLD